MGAGVATRIGAGEVGRGGARAPFVCLLLGGLLAAPALAQGAPTMPAADTEAYEMSLTLASACSPRRHGLAAGSESTIERDRDTLPGTAVFFHNVDGTFVVLEEYDEALEGHCLVLAWFGDAIEPGRHDVRRLSYAGLEEELASGSRSFYAMSAVRTAEESSMFVAEAGTLEVEATEPGRLSGRVELTGFLIQGGARTDGVRLTASFLAVESDS